MTGKFRIWKIEWWGNRTFDRKWCWIVANPTPWTTTPALRRPGVGRPPRSSKAPCFLSAPNSWATKSAALSLRQLICPMPPGNRLGLFPSRKLSWQLWVSTDAGVQDLPCKIIGQVQTLGRSLSLDRIATFFRQNVWRRLSRVPTQKCLPRLSTSLFKGGSYPLLNSHLPNFFSCVFLREKSSKISRLWNFLESWFGEIMLNLHPLGFPPTTPPPPQADWRPGLGTWECKFSRVENA